MIVLHLHQRQKRAINVARVVVPTRVKQIPAMASTTVTWTAPVYVTGKALLVQTTNVAKVCFLHCSKDVEVFRI